MKRNVCILFNVLSSSHGKCEIEKPLPLPTLPFLWEKSELHPVFVTISKTQCPLLFIKGGGSNNVDV